MVVRKPALPDAPWIFQTPSNAHEFKAQSTLLRTKIRARINRSPSLVTDALQPLEKGAEVMMHTAVLLLDEVANLQKANNATTRRRAYKKGQIRTKESLTIEQGASKVAAKKAIDLL